MGVLPLFATLRPQGFSVLLFAIEAAILAAPAPRLLAMAPLFAVWANLHGGWVMGLGTFGVWVALGLVWPGARQNRLGSAAAGVAAVLATLINPYGVGLWQVSLGHRWLRTPRHRRVAITRSAARAPDPVGDHGRPGSVDRTDSPARHTSGDRDVRPARDRIVPRRPPGAVLWPGDRHHLDAERLAQPRRGPDAATPTRSWPGDGPRDRHRRGAGRHPHVLAAEPRAATRPAGARIHSCQRSSGPDGRLVRLGRGP